MAANIAALLDKAKLIHKLPSDYKLSLVLGVSFSTPANYRTGKTLPDARVISLLCDLTGDDPALLAVEMEEQRAKSTEARAIWHEVAERLRSAALAGVHAAIFAVAVLVGVVGGFPSEAHAQQGHVFNVSKIYIVESHRQRWAALIRRLITPLVRYLARLSGSQQHASA